MSFSTTLSGGKRPNILLITTDEQRADTLGCGGNPHIETPNLDALCAKGIRFINHTTSCAICTPARASILTGQYPRTHGAWTVGTTLEPNSVSLAGLLSDAGYRTGIIGKVHLEPEKSEYVRKLDSSRPYYGFHETHITEDHNEGPYMDWIRQEHPQWIESARHNTHEDMRDTPLPPAPKGILNTCYVSTLPEELHQTAWIADRTMDFINHRPEDERPWFAWCSFVDPHHPFNPPASFAEKYDPATLPPPVRRNDMEDEYLPQGYSREPDLSPAEYQRIKAYYYAMITHIDHHIGRIMQAMKDQNSLEETIVIFTSDHGDYLGDHGLVRKGEILFDNILRIPLIIRLPGAAGAGTVCDRMTQHEDLAPTLLKLLEQPIPASMQGMDFSAALTASSTSEERKYAYHFAPKWHWSEAYGIRDKRWKLIYHPKLWGWRLFDLQADPNEFGDYLNDPACVDVVPRLKNQLLQWMLDTPAKKDKRTFDW